MMYRFPLVFWYERFENALICIIFRFKPKLNFPIFRRGKSCFFRVIFDGYVVILFHEFKWYFHPVFVLFLCSFDRFLYCFQTTLRLFSYNFILFLHFCILFLMYFHNICVLLLFFFCGILILFSKYFYCICKYEYFTKFRDRLNSY